jgi:hypothetical protein
MMEVISFCPPHSIFFISDPNEDEIIPEDTSETNIICTSNCISVWSYPETDGNTSLFICDSIDDLDEGYFTYEIETKGNEISITDSRGDSYFTKSTTSNKTRVNISTSDFNYPEIIKIYFEHIKDN